VCGTRGPLLFDPVKSVTAEILVATVGGGTKNEFQWSGRSTKRTAGIIRYRDWIFEA